MSSFDMVMYMAFIVIGIAFICFIIIKLIFGDLLTE